MNNNHKPESTFQTGALKLGTMQAVFIAVVVLIAILANLIIGKLPATFTQFDLSNNGMFTLSEQSLELCKNLDQPLTL